MKVAPVSFRGYMKKSELISSAFRWARVGDPDPHDQESVTTQYESFLKDSIERHPWYFSFKVLGKEDVGEADPSQLDFCHAYVMPSNVVGVFVLNPTDTNRRRYFSDRQALRHGYEPGPYNYADNEPFVFSNGILYTDIELEKIIVKTIPTISETPENFQRMLMFMLAEFVASADTEQDLQLARSLKSKAMESYTSALIKNGMLKVGGDRLLDTWFNVYIRSRR